MPEFLPLVEMGKIPFSTANMRQLSVTNTTYEKKREMKFTVPTPRRVNSFFTMKHGYGGYYIYGRIYKNGTAVGAEHSTGTVEVTFYDEFTDTFDITDLIQLYMRVSGSSGYLYDYSVSTGLVVTL